MTADEWHAGDDLWDRFDAYRHRDRNRLRALTCACARRVLEVAGPAAHPAFAGIVDVAERYAGGRATRAELLAARKVLRQSIKELRGTKAKHKGLVVSAIAELTDDTFEGFEYMLHSAGEVLKKTSGRHFPVVKGVLSGLVRDIFGNPFRPVTFDPSWRTDTAASLARQMYESREFSVMPILADALQDAGCGNPDILDHCRGVGPHVRGCWVVDLVLGKS
jgi:hypothetical protein